MSYKLLKKIISHLRRTEKCPYCQTAFSEDYLFILTTAASLGGEGCLGLFFVVCGKCHASAFVLVEAKSLTSKFRKEFIRVQTKSAGHGVSVNEVLDMHNFLKNWQGEDVKELFKEI